MKRAAWGTDSKVRFGRYVVDLEKLSWSQSISMRHVLNLPEKINNTQLHVIY